MFLCWFFGVPGGKHAKQKHMPHARQWQLFKGSTRFLLIYDTKVSWDHVQVNLIFFSYYILQPTDILKADGKATKTKHTVFLSFFQWKTMDTKCMWTYRSVCKCDACHIILYVTLRNQICNLIMQLQSLSLDLFGVTLVLQGFTKIEHQADPHTTYLIRSIAKRRIHWSLSTRHVSLETQEG